MKPVDQTTFGDPDGNCWGAALASVLEAPLSALPDYVSDYKAGRDWHGLMVAYLWNHYRLTVLSVDYRLTTQVTPIGYHLIGGDSPRGLPHSVVGLNGMMVHDPHPSRDGLVDVDEYEFLVPVDLEAIAGDEHRQAMEGWLTRRDCVCPECGGEGLGPAP